MYCSYCGAKLADNAAFCASCGEKVPNINPTPAKATSAIETNDQPVHTAPKVNTVPLSDGWIWVLALVPISLSMLMDYTGIASSIGFFSWVIVVGLNFFCIIKDMHELERFNIDAEGWFFLGCILVPLYLIVREVKTNRNLVPAVLWLFLFAVDIFIF